MKLEHLQSPAEFNLDNAYIELNSGIRRLESQMNAGQRYDRVYIKDYEGRHLYIVFLDRAIDLTKVTRGLLDRKDSDALEKFVVKCRLLRDEFRSLRNRIYSLEAENGELITEVKQLSAKLGGSKLVDVDLKAIEKLRVKTVYYQLKTLNVQDFNDIEMVFKRNATTNVPLAVENIFTFLTKVLDELHNSDQFNNFSPIIRYVCNVACWFIGEANKRGDYVKPNREYVLESLRRGDTDNFKVTSDMYDDPLHYRILTTLLIICYFLVSDYLLATNVYKRKTLLDLVDLIMNLSSRFEIDEFRPEMGRIIEKVTIRN